MGVTTMWGTVVKGLSIWMIENCRVFFFFNDFFSVLKFSKRDFFLFISYNYSWTFILFLKQLSFRLLGRCLSQPVYYHCTGTLLIPECWLCIYLLLWKRVYHLCRLFRASACKIILSTDRHNFKFSLSYI